ncbi:MAG: hypothetical protein RML93_06905 [Anaerolineales bacterium]|nr:YfhO family protein [Anaerolineales bacterium]MDW8447001.1 hypothetical protein [Anaerolineales bacterium]
MKNLRTDAKELILWLLPFILFAPGIFGGKAFFWGTILLQFIPWRHLALELLRRGELPLWNPLSGMGAPLLANYQAALLYPPTWVLIVLEALGGLMWSAVGQGVFLALHLGFCAVGMKRWLRELGLRDLGQMVGGMAFGLSGYLVSRASFQSILFSASWMPWVLLFAHRLVLAEGRERYRALFRLVGVIALSLLAGHAQTSWYILWTATAWVTWQSLCTSRGNWKKVWRWTGQRLLLWCGAVLWATCVAAAQLIPTGEYWLNSQRSRGIDPEVGLTYSFWPWRFLTILMPNFFGNPARGDYWGYANYWEDAIYSGAMALPLAVFALWRVLRRSSTSEVQPDGQARLGQVAWFWGLVGCFAMVLALGKNLPFFPWLVEHLPGFNLFQAPTRISIVAQFGLAVLAAIGIDLWEAPQGRILYWTRLGTAGFFSMLLVSSVVSAQGQELYPTIVRSVQGFGLLGFLFGLILLAKPFELVEGAPKLRGQFPLSPFVWQIGVLLFWAGDLLWMGEGINPVISRELYRDRFGSKAEVTSADGRYFIHPDDEYVIKFEEFFRFDTFQHLNDWVALRNSMLPNLNLLDKKAMVNNFDPFVPARFAAWMDALSGARRNGREEAYRRLLAESAVAYLIEMRDGRVSIESIEGEERFQFFPCAKIVSTPEAAIEAILSPAAMGAVKVVVEANELTHEKACEGNADESYPSIRVLSERARSIRVEIVTAQRGWLIVRDTFYPGWVAWVNGVRKEIRPANGVFRAVPLEPGKNRVDLCYQPLSWGFGVGLSLVSVAALFLLQGYRGYESE